MPEPRDDDATRRPIDEAAQDWFLRLASGEATAAERADFEAWRAADPRHRAAYDELRALWNDIEELRPAFATDEAGTGAHRLQANRGRGRTATSRRRLTQSALRFGRRHAVLGGLAAACLALFVAVEADLPSRLAADHSTATGEQARVTLPDGSIAYLNTDSAIALDYSESRRTVSLLRGEALFEVAKDPARPFDVLALKGRTTALGTAFAVRDQAEAATVTVTEGTVLVTAPVATDGAPQAGEGFPEGSSVTLTAGEQVTYGKGGVPGPVARVDPAAQVAWRRGEIVIDGLPLAQALAEIDRYRRGRILLLGDSARLERVTARLSLAAIDSGIRALAATHGLTVTRITAYLMIVR